MSNNSPSIMSNQALGKVVTWFVAINNWIKGFGIIAGGLAASVADWITGSIAFSILFSGANLPEPLTPVMIGTTLSLGAWGVQLLLWEMILSGNIKGGWKGEIGNKLAIGGVIIMKLCDDFTDLLAIFYMMQNNVLQGIMGENAYRITTIVVYVLSWILVGFSEIFVSISIYMLRGSKSYSQPQSNQNRGGGLFSRNRGKPSRSQSYSPLGSEIYDSLPKSTGSR